MINGTADDVVSGAGREFFNDLRKRTIAVHGNSKGVFDVLWNEGGGHRPYFITRPAAQWLQDRLHFPNWSAASIAAMGETHILDWAHREGVPMDKTYATELREGGTRGLGTDIPGVPHDEMNALPIERWNREKDRYIYESWVQRAREAH